MYYELFSVRFSNTSLNPHQNYCKLRKRFMFKKWHKNDRHFTFHERSFISVLHFNQFSSIEGYILTRKTMMPFPFLLDWLSQINNWRLSTCLSLAWDSFQTENSAHLILISSSSLSPKLTWSTHPDWLNHSLIKIASKRKHYFIAPPTTWWSQQAPLSWPHFSYLFSLIPIGHTYCTRFIQQLSFPYLTLQEYTIQNMFHGGPKKST